MLIENSKNLDIISSYQSQLSLLIANTKIDCLDHDLVIDFSNLDFKILYNSIVELKVEVEKLKISEYKLKEILESKEFEIKKLEFQIQETDQLKLKIKENSDFNQNTLETLGLEITRLRTELDSLSKHSSDLQSKNMFLEQLLKDKNLDINENLLSNSNKDSIDKLTESTLEIELELNAKNVELDRLRTEFSLFKSASSDQEEELNKKIKLSSDKLSVMKENEIILLRKEREWIDWNKINEEFINQSADVLRLIGKELNLQSEMNITRCFFCFIIFKFYR